MKQRDDLDRYYTSVDYLFKKMEKNEKFPDYFYESYLQGNNSIYQKNISETKIFDDEWIKTVESYFPSIDKITNNPRSFIKYEEVITNIERAKKTNAASIRHLASHTHFIKDINENNDVIPKKILTTNPEQDYDVYENRFIVTLINRLYLFVKNRYEIIKHNVESFQKDHIESISNFNFDKTEVSITLDMTIKKDLDNQTINEHNYDLLKRVEKLNALVLGLKNSKFMEMMKKSKPVSPPIMKTNVILKNPDFKSAYLLWLFLDRYNTMGYDVKVNEKNLEFDDMFEKDLKRLKLLSYSFFVANQTVRSERYNVKDVSEYIKRKTKIIKTNAKDVVNNPDLIQIEDNTINEYFLTKYKQIYSQALQKYEEDGKVKEEAAMKKALKDATTVVNSLYESIFNDIEEVDVFKKLIKEIDYDKAYDISKNKYKYAKMIREIKSVDFNNALRREKKLLSEMLDLSNALNKQNTLKKQEESSLKKKEMYDKKISVLKDKQAEYKALISEIDDINLIKQGQIDELIKLKQENSEKLDLELKELKAQESEKILKEKDKHDALVQKEKEALDELKKQEKEQRLLRKQTLEDKIKDIEYHNKLLKDALFRDILENTENEIKRLYEEWDHFSQNYTGEEDVYLEESEKRMSDVLSKQEEIMSLREEYTKKLEHILK